MAVADVFQALNQNRPYRPALPKEKVVDIMKAKAKQRHIDPDLMVVVLDDYNHYAEIAKSS